MERAESIPNLTPVGREAEVDLVPGTEVMTEIGGARFYHNEDNPDSVVLIPQPTDDPHDPLVSITPFWCFFTAPKPHPCLEIPARGSCTPSILVSE